MSARRPSLGEMSVSTLNADKAKPRKASLLTRLEQLKLSSPVCSDSEYNDTSSIFDVSLELDGEMRDDHVNMSRFFDDDEANLRTSSLQSQDVEKLQREIVYLQIQLKLMNDIVKEHISEGDLFDISRLESEYRQRENGLQEALSTEKEITQELTRELESILGSLQELQDDERARDEHLVGVFGRIVEAVSGRFPAVRAPEDTGSVRARFDALESYITAVLMEMQERERETRSEKEGLEAARRLAEQHQTELQAISSQLIEAQNKIVDLETATLTKHMDATESLLDRDVTVSRSLLDSYAHVMDVNPNARRDTDALARRHNLDSEAVLKLHKSMTDYHAATAEHVCADFTVYRNESERQHKEDLDTIANLREEIWALKHENDVLTKRWKAEREIRVYEHDAAWRRLHELEAENVSLRPYTA